MNSPDVEAFLNRLSDRERRILRERMGLDLSKFTLDDVAKGVEGSTERVRQIEQRARKLLNPDPDSAG